MLVQTALGNTLIKLFDASELLNPPSSGHGYQGLGVVAYCHGHDWGDVGGCLSVVVVCAIVINKPSP